MFRKTGEKTIYLVSRILIGILSLMENKKRLKKYFDIFLDYNNKRVYKKIYKKKVEKLLILIPHCIQLDTCNIKITSNVFNCKKCGRCNIGDIVELGEKYIVDIKVVTGGTLARKHIKERMPQVILAVACERDLISGIFDAYPLSVLGLLNIRKHGPCYNTEVNLEDMEKIIKKIMQEEI